MWETKASKALDLFGIETLDFLDEFAVGRVVHVEAGVQVSLADFMFVPHRFVYREPFLGLFDMSQVRFMVAVASRSEYLKVVEGCAGLVDLKSEVGTLLVDDRVLWHKPNVRGRGGRRPGLQ